MARVPSRRFRTWHHSCSERVARSTWSPSTAPKMASGRCTTFRCTANYTWDWWSRRYLPHTIGRRASLQRRPALRNTLEGLLVTMTFQDWAGRRTRQLVQSKTGGRKVPSPTRRQIHFHASHLHGVCLLPPCYGRAYTDLEHPACNGIANPAEYDVDTAESTVEFEKPNSSADGHVGMMTRVLRSADTHRIGSDLSLVTCQRCYINRQQPRLP